MCCKTIKYNKLGVYIRGGYERVMDIAIGMKYLQLMSLNISHKHHYKNIVISSLDFII
jgi:hypothetical protein